MLESNLPVGLAAVDCAGGEASLLDCPSDDAGLPQCSTDGSPFTDSTVLACGNTASGAAHYPRLWGSHC